MAAVQLTLKRGPSEALCWLFTDAASCAQKRASSEVAERKGRFGVVRARVQTHASGQVPMAQSGSSTAKARARHEVASRSRLPEGEGGFGHAAVRGLFGLAATHEGTLAEALSLSMGGVGMCRWVSAASSKTSSAPVKDETHLLARVRHDVEFHQQLLPPDLPHEPNTRAGKANQERRQDYERVVHRA